jgi:hypothetical protein
MVVGDGAANAGMKAALDASTTQPMSDETWKVIQQDVDFYGKPTSPADAEARIQTLNAQLKTFYAKSGVDQAAALKANPEMAARAAIANALRSDLDATMQAATGDGVSQLKRQYADLRQIDTSATDRALRLSQSDSRWQFRGPNLKQVAFATPGGYAAIHGAATGNWKEAGLGAAEIAAGGALGMSPDADRLIESAFNAARNGGTLATRLAAGASAVNKSLPALTKTAAALRSELAKDNPDPQTLQDLYNQGEPQTPAEKVAWGKAGAAIQANQYTTAYKLVRGIK